MKDSGSCPIKALEALAGRLQKGSSQTSSPDQNAHLKDATWKAQSYLDAGPQRARVFLIWYGSHEWPSYLTLPLHDAGSHPLQSLELSSSNTAHAWLFTPTRTLHMSDSVQKVPPFKDQNHEQYAL